MNGASVNTDAGVNGAGDSAAIHGSRAQPPAERRQSRGVTFAEPAAQVPVAHTYIYIYICIYLNMFIYIYIYIHIYTYIYIFMYMYVCLCLCMYNIQNLSLSLAFSIFAIFFQAEVLLP